MQLSLFSIYVGLGVGAAIVVLVRRVAVAGQGPAVSCLLMLILWPFFLPTALDLEPVTLPTRARRLTPPSSPRLRELGARLEDASSGRAEGPMLEAFLDRLGRSERSLAEMDRVLARAPDNVRGQLELLRLRSGEKLEHDVGLLEEVIAHLTLLRFAELNEMEPGEVEESRILGLLAEIKALVELNAETRA